MTRQAMVDPLERSRRLGEIKRKYPTIIEKKYKYITIRQVNDELFEHHPVYRIFNTRSSGQIGVLSWYTPWKQYVFSSIAECVFNGSCLRDVLDFLEDQITPQGELKNAPHGSMRPLRD